MHGQMIRDVFGPMIRNVCPDVTADKNDQWKRCL